MLAGAVQVVKEFTFDAAHFLPDHPGECKHIHGHTYRLQIGLQGYVDKTGMVQDFKDIKAMVQQHILRRLDHKFLNYVGGEEEEEGYAPLPKPFPKECPTAELMVLWIVAVLSPVIIDYFSWCRLSFVRLYETPTSYVEWRKDLLC